jgi:chromosome partitioning protein
LQEHFGNKVYRTVIPRNVRLAEAPSFGIPVLYHDKLSKGTQAYLALAGELLNRYSEDSSPLVESPASQIEIQESFNEIKEIR